MTTFAVSAAARLHASPHSTPRNCRSLARTPLARCVAAHAQLGRTAAAGAAPVAEPPGAPLARCWCYHATTRDATAAAKMTTSSE